MQSVLRRVLTSSSEMTRLVLSLLLLVIGVFGKQILVPEDLFVPDEVDEIINDIPKEISDDDEIIPTNGIISANKVRSG